MSIRVEIATALASANRIAVRIERFDWERVSQDLDAQGSALLQRLVSTADCRALTELYPEEEIFRSRVVMERHHFGRGEYRYFSYPLPDLVAGLRTAIYPHLVPIANRWTGALGSDVRYPEKHADFIARCHEAGQFRPTPFCFNTKQMITTACTKTFTASTFSRCRSRFCCPYPGETSPAGSS